MCDGVGVLRGRGGVMASGATLTDEDVRRLADDAGVDRKSVERRLLGLPVKGRAGERADRAIASSPWCTSSWWLATVTK